MATANVAYQGTGTLTITIPADGAARESNAYDNGTNLDLDLHLMVKFTAGTVTGNKRAEDYLGVSHDGTAWEDILTGADAAYTFQSPSSLTLARVISTPTSSREYEVFIPVGSYFGGGLPKKSNVILKLDGTGTITSLSISYQRIGATSA